MAIDHIWVLGTYLAPTEPSKVGVYGLAERSFSLWRFSKVEGADIVCLSRVIYDSKGGAQLAKRLGKVRYRELSIEARANIENAVDQIIATKRAASYNNMYAFFEKWNRNLVKNYGAKSQDADVIIRNCVLNNLRKYSSVSIRDFKEEVTREFKKNRLHKFLKGQEMAGRYYQTS